MKISLIRRVTVKRKAVCIDRGRHIPMIPVNLSLEGHCCSKTCRAGSHIPTAISNARDDISDQLACLAWPIYSNMVQHLFI